MKTSRFISCSFHARTHAGTHARTRRHAHTHTHALAHARTHACMQVDIDVDIIYKNNPNIKISKPELRTPFRFATSETHFPFDNKYYD